MPKLLYLFWLSFTFLIFSPLHLLSSESFPNEPPFIDEVEPGFEPNQTPSLSEEDISLENAELNYNENSVNRNSRYKRNESKHSGHTYSLRGGALGSPDLVNEKSNFTFEDIYGDGQKAIIFFDFAWNAFKKFGHINLKLATGIYWGTGQGKFTNTALNPNLSPPEEFTFLLLPNFFSVQYKFQFARNPWLVPYIEGGIGYFTFAELRDDGERKFGGALTTGLAGGLQFSLNWLEPYSAANLDRAYGVNNTWFIIEYKSIIGLNKKYDFSSSVINGGFAIEF